MTHDALVYLASLDSGGVRLGLHRMGMEGALPSVVGGLVSVPVIAVPASAGYGVTVCSIDNGFGAAFAALRILQSSPRYRLEPQVAP